MGSHISFLNLGPVDDLPDLLQEVGSHVLVVQVVSVLPDVDRQQGNEMSALVDQSVLVSGRAVLKLLRRLVVGEPAPAGSLNGGRVGRELRDERIEASPLVLDGLKER